VGFSKSFDRFAKVTAKTSGHPSTFGMAVAVIVLWALTGPLFKFSDTWQLVINTGTTIVTFLMVFLIQNTQNRDSGAMHLKLDELLRAVQGAHTALVDLEDLTEAELDLFKARYAALGHQAKTEILQGRKDTDSPELPE
jgi:low affinity Fe/Cu permease